VGGALELALLNAGYGARFLDPTLADEPAELLNGDRLVLLGLRLGAQAKKALLLGMRSVPQKAEVPVLELVAALDGPAEGPVIRVAWPCRMEDLLRKIEAALRAASDDGVAPSSTVP
jgi:hypothetical protein